MAKRKFTKKSRKRKTRRVIRKSRGRKRPRVLAGSKSQRAGAASLAKLWSKNPGPMVLTGNVETGVGSGIPRFIYAKQIYFDQVQIGDASSVPAKHTFRLNSTFDPNETAAGHQPKGRDNMAGIYGHYTVLGCKWKVILRNDSGISQLCGIYITTDSTLGSNFDSLREVMETPSRYNKKIYLGATGDVNEADRRTLKGYVGMKRFMTPGGGSFGEQFESLIGAEPTIIVRLHVWSMDSDGSASASSAVLCNVLLKYYVVYHGISAVTSS